MKALTAIAVLVVLAPLASALPAARDLSAPLGGKWDPDWTLGGKYNTEKGQYEKNCACKNVQYGRFASKGACEEDMFSNDSSCVVVAGAVHFDRNTDLGGVSVEGRWAKLCECKQVGWTTAFTDEKSCVDDWLKSEANCLIRASQGFQAASQSAPLGQKWEPDWSLGGKYNNERGQYEKYCACKNVQWGKFTSQGECELDMFSNDSLCIAPAGPTHYDRNTDLGGVTVGGRWAKLCECKEVGWTTPFTNEKSCVDDWLKSDANCLIRASDGLQAASQSAPLGEKWEADWNLGGKYNNERGRYEKYCACKNVQWGKFGSKSECEEDMFANNSSCIAPVTSYFDRNHDLGGITVEGVWRKLCECKSVGWTTQFTDKAACQQEWVNENSNCMVRA
eukprot:Platyproteum_vivax@DN7481_c0_g1_i2.p1